MVSLIVVSPTIPWAAHLYTAKLQLGIWNEAEGEWGILDMLSDLFTLNQTSLVPCICTVCRNTVLGQTMVAPRTRWRHRKCDSDAAALPKSTDALAGSVCRPLHAVREYTSLQGRTISSMYLLFRSAWLMQLYPLCHGIYCESSDLFVQTQSRVLNV